MRTPYGDHGLRSAILAIRGIGASWDQLEKQKEVYDGECALCLS